MAEYLAPAVYVEEIDTGPKPIEGVSTSTAGMVGVTERGPLDVPILVTSIGEYERWFGGRLPRRDFIDPTDADRAHCYLPHAVEGFFTNGGKRAYIVRVAPTGANRALAFLHGRAAAGDAGTVLLRSAGQGGGLPPEPLLYVLDTTGISVGETIRVGDGSSSEYREVANVTAPVLHLPLSAPLERGHAAATAVAVATPAAPAVGTLGAAAAAGATSLTVATAVNLSLPASVPVLVEISSGGLSDIVVVQTASATPSPGPYVVNLVLPLPRAYPNGAAVRLIATAPAANTLDIGAAAGDQVAFRNSNVPAAVAGQMIEFEPGTANHEARWLGALASFQLDQALPADTPAGSEVAHVAAPTNIGAITAKALSADAAAGTRVIALNNRVDLAVGQLLRIGVAPAEEYAVIAALGGTSGAAPDAGTVTLALPLTADHASTAQVRVQNDPAAAANGMTRTLFDVDAGGTAIAVHAGHVLVAGNFVRITRPDGVASLHRLGTAGAFGAIGAVTLLVGLDRDHARGAPVAERRALIRVEALDVGAWGDRLLVSVEDESIGLSNRTETTAINDPLEIRVRSLTGIEAGTLLEVTSPSGGTVLLKVRRIDRTNRAVTFDPPALDAAAMATLGAGPWQVRSREFALTVRLRRRPDPAVPSRDSMIIASESYRHLSMDARHSRYFTRVIGDIDGALRLEDRRPEGDSALIRVAESDLAADTTAIREGPETLVDAVPSGGTAPARHALAGGDDGIPSIDDNTYLGADAVEPVDRTGLHALKSIQNVSIVAVPGQASAALQAGVIAHCELMRYRFAVLDADEPAASLADVQQQRQAFDTKYAGLYYPWLTIPDPHPETLNMVRDFALPPSGHMIGIYARTDEERGVHKAPANEVVRGITGLTKKLSKGEHDILNPSPVNINVIRDFRPDGRGIRAWGARCITSDSDYKYVPVRRLLIFLEQSMERGLQWVVFEPNSEALWARVRRTIRNFLTDVWRSGALEGVKPEEAFFVKCDRTTMTQTDIDNGRLICVIGVAPVKPAEFVIVRIGLFTANAEE
jgi:phage tail sheath protein FI